MSVAADIDLFAACLDAGLNTRDAADAVAGVVDGTHRDMWITVAALLGIGMPVDKAMSAFVGTGGLEELANLAAVSAQSGSAFSKGCRRIVDRLREEDTDHRTEAAERTGVLIALPLATCFLPAFMILGLAPVVMGLGMHLFTNL
jgi:Bacterial type II secretion system protein F domain.